MKKLIILILLFTIYNIAQAEPITKVRLEPYEGGVSFNTITFADFSLSGWVTCSSATTRGRKRIMILNTSTTDNLFLTDVSGSTAIGTLYPRERAIFGVDSSINIYVSANTVLTLEYWEIR